MKIEKILISLAILLVLPSISALIVDGDCPIGETCMFSIYQLNDSHMAECGYFNYSVCYPSSINISIEETCSAGICVLSQYQNNDSHMAECGYYNYSLCVQGTTCDVGAPCNRENKLISLNKINNSHVGEYLYYPIGLCCGNVVRGLGGLPSVTPPTPEEELPEIVVEVVEIVKKVPVYAWLAVSFLFFIGWRRRRKKCDECKIKSKRKNLTSYREKNYCKKCFKKLTIKEAPSFQVTTKTKRFINP